MIEVPIEAVAIVAVVLAISLLALWLIHWSERAPGGGLPSMGGGRAATPPQVTEFLDRVALELQLPAVDAAEVRAELADHLADSIRSLEEEGFGPEGATTEALGRMGPARELGRQIRVAHQSRRRLLAGAGGGVVAAAGGFVVGYLAATAAVLAGLLGIGGILFIAGVKPPYFASADGGQTVNSLLVAVGLIVGVVTAMRYAVRSFGAISRRRGVVLARSWGIFGVAMFGLLVIFGMRGPQSWPAVLLELAAPVVALGAAVIRIERPIVHVPRWAAGAALVPMAGALLFAVVSIGMGSVTVVDARSVPGSPDRHLDIVAPMAPAKWLPAGTDLHTGYGGDGQPGTIFLIASMPAPSPAIESVLSQWHGLRFEAWHAQSASGIVAGVDPGSSSPFDIEPVESVYGGLQARFHLDRFRDGNLWWVVLTGVAPDGVRYRLHDGGGGTTTFYGSVWDWLTAPE
jgi:hypothetical protein